MKLKTAKEIDVAHFREKNPQMKKLQFSKIQPLKFDVDKQIVTFSYLESIIEEENVEITIPVYDENGLPVINEETGLQQTETIISDRIGKQELVTKDVSFEIWYGLKEQIYAGFSDEMTEQEKEEVFFAEGLKYYIATYGYYQGSLTIDDFVTM